MFAVHQLKPKKKNPGTLTTTTSIHSLPLIPVRVAGAYQGTLWTARQPDAGLTHTENHSHSQSALWAF